MKHFDCVTSHTFNPGYILFNHDVAFAPCLHQACFSMPSFFVHECDPVFFAIKTQDLIPTGCVLPYKFARVPFPLLANFREGLSLALPQGAWLTEFGITGLIEDDSVAIDGMIFISVKFR